jgi:hypothetical protein
MSGFLYIIRNFAASFIAAGFLVAIPAISVQAQQTEPASIAGSVEDPQGLPLSDVALGLQGPSNQRAESDGHGHFTFTGIGPGLYTITARKTSYTPTVRSEIALVAGSSTAITIVMQPLSFSTLRVIASVQTTRGTSLNTSTAAINDIAGSVFTDQGSSQVTQVLNETPGIITAITQSHGNADGASMSTLQVPQIRGARPYETESLIDGHPVSVGADGFFTPLYVNPYFLQDVEIVKGPGSIGTDINYAIGGSINYRTLDPTRTNHAALTMGLDSYGGLSTNITTTGTIKDRLGYVFGYGINGSPGPLNNFRPYGISGSLTSGIATINGAPICGSVALGASCLLGATAGKPGVYQGFTLTSPIELCCDSVSSQYNARSEIAKIRYNFSQQTSIMAAFLGAQSLQSAQQSSFFDGLDFVPSAGYSGSIPANSLIPFGLDTYSPVEFQQTEGQFESELRTAVGKDTLLFRYYAGSNDSTQYKYPFGLNYQFTAQTWGSLPIGPGGSEVYFHGQPETYGVTYSSYSFPTQDHYGGLSGEIDIPSSDNLYTVSVDRTTHNAYEAENYEVPGESSIVIPHGSSQTFTTVLARGNFAVTPDVDVVFGNYLISYASHYTADGGASWQDATHSFYGPRLAATWQPRPDAIYRFSLGSSIAPPYLALITTQGGAPLPNLNGAVSFYTQSANNGNINPETAFGYDLGMDRRLDHGVIFSGDVYLTNLHGQYYTSTDVDGTYTPTSGVNAGKTAPLYVTEARNLGSSRYDGIELALFKRPAQGLGYRIQGSLERAYVFSIPPGFYDTAAGPNTTNLTVIPNINFANIPYSMGYGELNYRAPRAFYSLGLTYYGPNNTYNQPAFGVLSANARWQVARHTSLQISAYNLGSVYPDKYFSYDGGIARPMINGMVTTTQGVNVGPTTFQFIFHQDI